MQDNIVDGKINSDKYIEFLGQIIENRQRPLILMTDHAKFHKSEKMRHFVRTNRSKIRVFFLLKRSPKFNPNEQVWNEIKNNKIGKQPVIANIRWIKYTAVLQPIENTSNNGSDSF